MAKGPLGWLAIAVITVAVVTPVSPAQQLLTLVNADRRAVGAPLLVWDERIAAVAQGHAEEMWTLGYYSHFSPVTGGASRRLWAAGITYAALAETIAQGWTVAQAYKLLMGSSAHRAAILSPRYVYVGVAVVKGPRGMLMVVMNFVRPRPL